MIETIVPVGHRNYVHLSPANLMANSGRDEQPAEPIPLLQRVYDNVFLMLALGLIVMLVVFTAWGLWEIYTMPRATLP